MAFWEKQKKVKALYELVLKPVRIKHGISQMEFSVLLFLDRNPEENTASDIVRICQFTKSHVSMAISGLEKMGLITRYYTKGNNKTIRLSLTDRAKVILDDARSATKQYESIIFDGFSEEDLLRIQNYFERLCQNAERKLKQLEEAEADA